MVNDETKKYRELMAYGLLASAALAVIAALSLLFKSSDDLGGNFGFAEKAALYGSLFESGLIILALVGAVVLVTRLGEPSPNARIVVLAAMGIGAVDLLFAVITFFAQFGASSGFVNFSGVAGAGKTVGAIGGLAELTFLAVGLFYIFTAFRSLPAPVAAPAQQWGPYAGQQAWPQSGPGQPQQGQPQPGQAPQGWAQQGWAQPGAAAGWAASGTGQQPTWGQPQPPAPVPPVAPATAPAWPQPDPTGWGQQQSYAPPATPTPPPPADAPAPFWAAVEEPAAVPEASEPNPTDADSVERSEAHVADAPERDDALPSDDATEAGPVATDEDSPPAQGWWQHPQQ